MLVIFEIEQGVDAPVGPNDHIPSGASITPVGSGVAHVFVAMKTFTSLSAVAGLKVNPGFIYKNHAGIASSSGNLGDTQRSAFLTMTGAGGRIFAAAVLEGDDFIVQGVLDNFRGDFDPFHERLTDAYVITVGEE
jgi:hypothetical protein